MKAKRLDVEDAAFRRAITEQVRFCLARLERHGMVRKVIVAPDVWWELVGNDMGWQQQTLL